MSQDDKNSVSTPCGCPESTGGPFGSPGPVCIGENHPGCRKRTELARVFTPSAERPAETVKHCPWCSQERTCWHNQGEPCQKDAIPSSERAQEPQSTYTPLTRDQIKALRGVLHKGGHQKTAWELKQWDTLCDMAVNALLYAEEIHRLRAAPSATSPTNSEMRGVWDMLLLDGNCSEPNLQGAAKLRQILDDLISARSEASTPHKRFLTWAVDHLGLLGEIKLVTPYGSHGELIQHIVEVAAERARAEGAAK